MQRSGSTGRLSSDTSGMVTRLPDSKRGGGDRRLLLYESSDMKEGRSSKGGEADSAKAIGKCLKAARMVFRMQDLGISINSDTKRAGKQKTAQV